MYTPCILYFHDVVYVALVAAWEPYYPRDLLIGQIIGQVFGVGSVPSPILHEHLTNGRFENRMIYSSR